MTAQTANTTAHRWHVRDAHGRRVPMIDPVRIHLLHMPSIIPAETLQSMTKDLLPNAKRQQRIQLASMLFGVVFVVGGYFVYFGWYSNWKGLDPVNTSIMVLQALVILSGPVIAFRMARATYVGRVAEVMLARRHCPHCAYNLHGLPVSETDQTTTCPECGCTWQLTSPGDPAS
jgi:hypothetical protein